MVKKVIYCVTSGEYEEYGIDMIFTTRELAEKFIDKFRNQKSLSIEERECDNLFEEYDNLAKYLIRVNKKGDIVEFRAEELTLWEMKDKLHNYREVLFDCENNLAIMGFFKTSEEARKNALETFENYKTKGIWGNKK